MSHIRPLTPYTYVEGKNITGDYVFESSNKKGKYVEDYGHISNPTIIEILFRQAYLNDDILLKHLAIRLAENLYIKVRKKPLTSQQFFDMTLNMHQEGS